jgi:hypothetical protein
MCMNYWGQNLTGYTVLVRGLHWNRRLDSKNPLLLGSKEREPLTLSCLCEDLVHYLCGHLVPTLATLYLKYVWEKFIEFIFYWRRIWRETRIHPFSDYVTSTSLACEPRFHEYKWREIIGWRVMRTRPRSRPNDVIIERVYSNVIGSGGKRSSVFASVCFQRLTCARALGKLLWLNEHYN